VEIITVALQVITFDHYGASGHANHIQTSKGTVAGVDVANQKLQLLLLVRIKIVYFNAQCLLRSCLINYNVN
jgi:LmbE family N-acetylglucosaminyl deacetylase